MATNKQDNKKQKRKNQITKPSGFYGGMVSDPDPRLQPKTTYRYARNISLINLDGTSLTVENANGNRKIVDLLDYFGKDKQGNFGFYNYNTSSIEYYGPQEDNTDTNLNQQDFAGNIVGHYSFKNQLFLIVCGITKFSQNESDFRTQFLLLDFDNNGEVLTVKDLRVSFNANGGAELPNINMDPTILCRVEGLVENECLTRVYWTDNKNPLRTLSLKSSTLTTLDPNELDVKPQASFNQPLVDKTIPGSLLSGVYAYAFKYKTDDGAVSGISPISDIYHVSNKSLSGSATYYGSNSGLPTSYGLQIKVGELDERYDSVEFYSIYYQDLDNAPVVSKIGEKSITGSSMVFTHSSMKPEIPLGLTEVLIPSNTWDLCKDIAVKDNILFAANLRSIQNVVGEKEWNVRVRRCSLHDLSTGSSSVVGVLTTTDTEVKDYTLDSSGNPFELYQAGSYKKWDFSNSYKACSQSHRYMPEITDKPVLGAMSYGFLDTDSAYALKNGLGGCRVSFYNLRKLSENKNNKGKSNDLTYGSYSSEATNLYTDSYTDINDSNNSNNYKLSLSNIGGAKDMVSAGSRRGFQRGETYRFGVLVYDKAGNPGNVLWIGDIQMPYHSDRYYKRRIDNYTWDSVLRDDLYEDDTYSIDYRMSSSSAMQVPGYVNKHNKFDQTFSDNGSTGASSSFEKNNMFFSPPGVTNHYTYDLGLVFEFKIPQEVRNKISGFKVVRAERTENDRSVLQQGALAQTVYYSRKSATNQYSFKYSPSTSLTNLGSETDETNPLWPEYETLLGGYIGLNYYQNNLDGSGGDGTAANEYIDTSDAATSVLLRKDQDGFYSSAGGADTNYTTSRYFGYDAWGTYKRSGGYTRNTRHICLNTWVMYSPDSAFGVRPYQHVNGNRLSIISTLKAVDKIRVKSDPEIEATDEYGNATGVTRTFNTSDYPSIDTSINEVSVGFQYGGWNAGSDKGDYFTTKKVADSDQRATAHSAVFAVYDTQLHQHLSDLATGDASNSYFNSNGKIQYVTKTDNSMMNVPSNTHTLGSATGNRPSGAGIQETSGDYGAGQNDPFSTEYLGSGVSNYYANCKNLGNYFELGNSKEITDGEIVGKEFFEDSKGNSFPTGFNTSGFSNHTLGFAWMSSGNGTWRTDGSKDAGAIDGGNFSCTVQSKDYTSGFTNGLMPGQAHRDLDINQYSTDTVSQLMRGTRGIILNIAETTPTSLSSLYNSRSTSYNRFSGTIDIARVISEQNWWASNGSKKGMNYAKNKKIPYIVSANIVRELVDQYGGNTKQSIEETVYNSCGHYHPINVDTEGHTSIVFGGDTFVTMYSHQVTTSPYPANSATKFLIFPVESFVNTQMRSGLHLGNGDHEEGFDQDNLPVSNDWLYNPVYSQEKNLKRFVSVKESDCDIKNLPYEIAYSQTKLTGEPTDAFRSFPYLNFHDVEGTFGEITGLINHNNEIYFTQEKAFGKLIINPRTFVKDDATGDSIFTGQGNILETEMYISNVYGTRHINSIVNSDKALYFFDVDNEKILQFIEGKGLRVLSDEKGIKNKLNKYLNLGRLKVYQKYKNEQVYGTGHIEDRIYHNDMPLRFIGIHGTFDKKKRNLIYTILDGARIDKQDRLDNEAKHDLSVRKTLSSYKDNVFKDESSGSLQTRAFNPWTNDNAGIGYADRLRFNNTLIYNEELDTFVTWSDYTPSQWINHNGYVYSTANRQVFTEWNVSITAYPTSLAGTTIANYSHEDSMDYKDIYRYGSNRLKQGSVQLWMLNGSEEKNILYNEDANLMQIDDLDAAWVHSASDFTSPNPLFVFDGYDNIFTEYPKSYTSTGHDIDGNQYNTYQYYIEKGFSRHHLKRIYPVIFEASINDFSTVNKKYDNVNIHVTADNVINNGIYNSIDRNGYIVYGEDSTLFGVREVYKLNRLDNTITDQVNLSWYYNTNSVKNIMPALQSNSDAYYSYELTQYEQGAYTQVENTSFSSLFDKITYSTDVFNNNTTYKFYDKLELLNKLGDNEGNTTTEDIQYFSDKLDVYTSQLLNHKYREGVLNVPVSENKINDNLFNMDYDSDTEYNIDYINSLTEKTNKLISSRIVGSYLNVKLVSRTHKKFNIFAITAKFRKSFN